VQFTGLTDPVLHVILGLLIYLTALRLGRSPSIAFGVVLIIQLVNELNDLILKPYPISVLLPGSVEDTAFTVAIPFGVTLLWVLRQSHRKHKLA
jgi:hypothetical protein